MNLITISCPALNKETKKLVYPVSEKDQLHLGDDHHHIKNSLLTRNEKHCGKYICLECHQELIPHTGEINRWYFSHKQGSKCLLMTKNYGEVKTGGGESDNHLLAKYKLYEWLLNRKTITILGSKCCACENHSTKINIEYQEYDVVKTEYKINDIRVDVAIINYDNIRYCFEIYHSNKTKNERPDPWFEISASEINTIKDEYQEILLRDIKFYHCGRCSLPKEKNPIFIAKNKCHGNIKTSKFPEFPNTKQKSENFPLSKYENLPKDNPRNENCGIEIKNPNYSNYSADRRSNIIDSLLIKSIITKDCGMIDVLINSKMDLNFTDGGLSPITAAIQMGDNKLLIRLINNGANFLECGDQIFMIGLNTDDFLLCEKMLNYGFCASSIIKNNFELSNKIFISKMLRNDLHYCDFLIKNGFECDFNDRQISELFYKLLDLKYGDYMENIYNYLINHGFKCDISNVKLIIIFNNSLIGNDISKCDFLLKIGLKYDFNNDTIMNMHKNAIVKNNDLVCEYIHKNGFHNKFDDQNIHKIFCDCLVTENIYRCEFIVRMGLIFDFMNIKAIDIYKKSLGLGLLKTCDYLIKNGLYYDLNTAEIEKIFDQDINNFKFARCEYLIKNGFKFDFNSINSKTIFLSSIQKNNFEICNFLFRGGLTYDFNTSWPKGIFDIMIKNKEFRKCKYIIDHGYQYDFINPADKEIIISTKNI